MLLFVVLGLVIGLLASMTGLGGGFLIVPFLIYMGKNASVAVGTSFLVILLISISSSLAHFRLGNIDYKTALLLAGGGIVGAQIGPLLLQQVPEQGFKRAFAGILVALGVWMFFNARGTS